MDADIRRLKQCRAQIKGQVTRIIHFFEAGTATIADVQVRLQRLEGFFQSFEAVQIAIEEKVNLEEGGERNRRSGKGYIRINLLQGGGNGARNNWATTGPKQNENTCR